ncbi:MAG: hypothetical protein J3K34DRAFT_445970, partial [Monoraphidium minutum]
MWCGWRLMPRWPAMPSMVSWTSAAVAPRGAAISERHSPGILSPLMASLKVIVMSSSAPDHLSLAVPAARRWAGELRLRHVISSRRLPASGLKILTASRCAARSGAMAASAVIVARASSLSRP